MADEAMCGAAAVDVYLTARAITFVAAVFARTRYGKCGGVKKLFWFGLVGLVLLVLGPVIVARFTPHPAPRQFSGARLEETRYREVTFRNDNAGLELAGMLFVPEGAGPFPAAVIIQGSGSSRRDNRWYLTLARYLQEHGIAVLLPDKRGSERSQGEWRTASFDALASDAIAALSFLQRQGEVPVAQIGVIGLSQGGHIAPLVATKERAVAHVINVVGSSLPMHELLVYEEEHNLRELGVLPGISHLLARVSSWYVRTFAQRDFWQAIGNFDPLPFWRELRQPALVLYGADDTNVPSQASAERLNGLNKANIRVVVFEGSGHALASPADRGDSIFREDALQQIADFIHTSGGR